MTDGRNVRETFAAERRKDTFSSINARVAGITVLTIIEMIPDIALLILLIPVVGIGVPPTVSAAVLYSPLPVARNTTAGLGGQVPTMSSLQERWG